VLTVSDDLLALRLSVVQAGRLIQLSRVDQTKLATAAIELGRNALIHGGGGSARVQLRTGVAGRQGVAVTIADGGPGIASIPEAMRDGFSTGGGLGLGLGGAERLVNEFDLDSTPGGGTLVTIVRWA
jgi:serine/threonine-protein kinase RsbT